MEILFIAMVIGFIPAIIANKKGRDFLPWYLYGVLLFIVALIHSLVLEAPTKVKEARLAGDGYRKCPQCAEMIKAEARKCRYCQSEVVAVDL